MGTQPAIEPDEIRARRLLVAIPDIEMTEAQSKALQEVYNYALGFDADRPVKVEYVRIP